MKRPLLALLPILLIACSTETTTDTSPTVTPSTNSTEVATTSVVATTSTTEPTVSRLSTDQRLSSTQILDEPERCQIADITPYEGSSSGFPRPVDNKLLQDLRVLVVPISVRDYLFSEDDLKLAETGLTKSAEFWNSMSYGNFNLESTFLPKESWLTFDETAEQLGLISSGPMTDYQAFVEMAMTRLSEKMDTSKFDVFFVALPAVNDFLMGQAMRLGEVFISDKEIQQNAIFVGGGYLNFWEVTAHELGHVGFGLEDLYSFETQSNIFGDWDIMQMAILVPSKEITSWSRWIAGWLDDSQVQCLEKQDSATLFIEPIEVASTQPKSIVVRASPNSVLVAESRRNLGYDVSGSSVLIYTVDTSNSHGFGPYKFEGTLNAIGETLTVGSISFSLADTDVDGDLVSISIQ
jgi:hypothetical protein